MTVALSTAIGSVTTQGTNVRQVGGGVAPCSGSSRKVALSTAIGSVTTQGTNVRQVGGGT